MGSLPAETKVPWLRTPCILSRELSRVAGCNIYLKLDNLQPGGSFKTRGVGNMMTQAVASSTSAKIRFYCSSGGNAGLACATTAITLGCPATIVIPSNGNPLMKPKLLALGVELVEHGSNWPEADAYLRNELLAKDPTGVYVPPFDHPQVWDGAASIVSELREQLEGVPLHGIVCSVGGGGLVNGIMQGVESQPWAGGVKPKVIAVETTGADSLNASVRAGSHVTLPGITSIAKSLGATRVSERTWRWSQESDNLESIVVSDADAAISCVRFADDAKLLVEVACGAALAPAYRGDLRELLGKGLRAEEWASKNVVLEVCGGAGVTLELLAAYKEEYKNQTTIKC